MNHSGESSTLEIFLQCMSKLWEPAGAAFSAQNELGVHSLAETPAVLERAGYEISRVDVPEKVSGFAEIIAEKPHIVLNRQKPPENLQYTLTHELGHHILHLNPVRKSDKLGFPSVGIVEFEADLFAATWLLFLADDDQRNDVLVRNPESSRAIVSYLFLTILLALVMVLMHLFMRPIPETK